MGVPDGRVREVSIHAGGNTGRRHEGVGSGNDVVCALDDEGLLDFAHDGVDGGVQTEGFLYDLGVESELGEVVVGESGEVFAEDALLFFEELLDDFGLGAETENHPRDGGCGGVLARHEERDHDTGDFVVGERGSVLVLALHQVPDHVVAVSTLDLA